MQVVGRLNFPKSADVSSLYIRCNEGATINYEDNDNQIVFSKGSSISSNSYFNSFYEKFYAKYTTIKSIYYLLKLEGDFQIAVYREVYGATDRELISIDKFENCQLSESIKILLPNLIENENAGRIYIEIVCLSERGLFQEGLIATEQNKDREVSLAIISCTFKKEIYIKNTVNTILNNSLLLDKKIKIFVVDNGKTLNEDDFPDARLQLIPNNNVGGSGGFTRGLIEALESNAYSHFLLMDDDIELDSECIYRLFALYEYGKFDFAVAGSMLDLYKKHVLSEAGALYSKNQNTMKARPFSLVSLKKDTDLKDATSLNLLLVEENIDYGAFWFFSFSKDIIEQIGLPLPFFIKGDDIEFSLRIKESFGDKILAFPSIAVWHEPFYLKHPIWDHYYFYRNFLINYAIHGSQKQVNIIYNLTQEIIYRLFVFEYNSAEMIIKGFEDYLKGPEFIINNDPEVLHSKILELSKSYSSQNIQHNYLPPNQVYQQSRAGILKKVVSLLTLNGHLLPDFMTSDDEVFMWQNAEHAGQRSRALAKKRVLLYKEGSTFLFQNEIDKLAGIKLLTRWVKVVITSSTKWLSISTKWKNASTELTSTRFWQQYLGLKK